MGKARGGMMKSLFFLVLLYASLSFTKEPEFSEVFLAKYQARTIDPMYKKVMKKSFDPKKKKKAFRKYLKSLIKVSSNSDDHYIGSYVSELVDDKGLRPNFIWQEALKVASKEKVMKLKKDYLADSKAMDMGQDVQTDPFQISK